MSLPLPHPASAFDIFNVYFERIYDPTMHIVFAFEGNLDETLLKTATLRLLEADPYLRSRFAEGDKMPCWEEIAEEEWDRAFVRLPSGDGEGYTMPPCTPPPPLDVRKGPQLRVSISSTSEGDRVIVTCHHGFCDAGGLRDIAHQLFSTCREIKQDPDFKPAPTGWYDRSMKPVLAMFTKEEMKKALDNEKPFVDRWRFPVERLGRGTPRIESRTLSPERLFRAKEFGRKHGSSINDIMIGAFFLALLKIRKDPADAGAPRSLLTSADLRRHPGSIDSPDQKARPGTSKPVTYPPLNLSVAYEVTISAERGARLEDVIGRVTAVTKQRKAEGAAMGLGCILFYEKICAGGMPQVRAFFDSMMESYVKTGLNNPVFANIGIFWEDDFLPLEGSDGNPLALRNITFLPCVCWPYGFLMSLSTFRNAMTIIVAYEEGPYSGETVRRFLEYVDEYLP